MLSIYNFVKFPIWKDDGKHVVNLNDIQKEAIKEFLLEIEKGNITFKENPCLCGNKDKFLDIVVAEKDRYGIPCVNVLCRKCGLVRLKERMDDNSTAIFYKDFYRKIYVGKIESDNDFFNIRINRGKVFYDLLSKNIDMTVINNVFEIGCSSGGILYYFLKKGKKVAGCDFGEKYLNFGKTKGLNLFYGKINETMIKKQSQDLIILSHVMEHFNNPIEELLDIIEYIKPGGYLFVQVPSIDNIPNSYIDPLKYFQNAHVWSFNKHYLQVFFKEMHLDIIYIDNVSSVILQKPKNWENHNIKIIYNDDLLNNYKNVENKLKKYFLFKKYYYYKQSFIKIIPNSLKSIIKKLLR